VLVDSIVAADVAVEFTIFAVTKKRIEPSFAFKLQMRDQGGVHVNTNAIVSFRTASGRRHFLVLATGLCWALLCCWAAGLAASPLLSFLLGSCGLSS
jgi:hypothetical protein